MLKTITGLSQREADFLSRLAAENRSVFRVDEVEAFWQNSPMLHRVLSRLEQGGWLQRIERGLYMIVPLSAGPERTWSEDALVIGTRLVTPSAIAYWSALHFWNFTEQVPRTIFVQSPNRKFRSTSTVQGVRYQIVTVRDKSFFGLVERTIHDQTVQITDREKTILDAADRPDLCGGIWQLAETLRSYWHELDWQRLDAYLARFASGALYKRLGYLVETLDLPIDDRAVLLTSWQARMTTGIAPLDPSTSASGKGTTSITHRRWRVRDNIGFASIKKDDEDDSRS